MIEKPPNNSNINNYFSSDFFTFFGIFTGIIILVLAIRIYQLDLSFSFSLLFLPILSGLFFEQRRLNYSWKEILFKSFAAFCIFCLVVLMGLQDRKSFDSIDISFFLGIFIISFVGISISYAYYTKTNQNITAKITKGILLLQNISIIYFLFEIGLFNNLNCVKLLIIIPVILISCFVIFTSFSLKQPSEKSKFFLSIWSAIVTLIFSICIFFKTINIEISPKMNFNDNLIGTIQFFLLGISIIYTCENIWLIIRFMKGKGESWRDYKNRIKKLKQEHLERFEDNKIPISSSIFCLIFVSGTYGLNHIFNWLPSYTMIWIVFTFFPFIIYYWEKLFLTNKENIH